MLEINQAEKIIKDIRKAVKSLKNEDFTRWWLVINCNVYKEIEDKFIPKNYIK